MRATHVQLRIERRRRKLVFYVPVVAVVFAALAFILLRFSRDKEILGPPAGINTPENSEIVGLPLNEHRVTVRPGATIGTILADYGFSPADVQALYDQTKPVFDLRRLRAGRNLRLFAGPVGIVRLDYDVDDFHYLTILKGDSGFAAEIKAYPIDMETSIIWGTIEESAILAFNKLGEEDMLALSFADVFGWDIDFYIDLREGDAFKVIFEKKYLQGKFIGYGNILAAEITNQGKVHQAFYYAAPDTRKPGHYDADGKSL
ncbi:MAG: hypothetical protein AB1715_09970, partial [Acidobacteriota bacterium]